MSWVDKAHKRSQLEKQIEQIINSPKYRQQQRELEQQCVLNAFARFTFMMCGYLETRHGYKSAGLKKFLEFVKLSMKCTEDDENFFLEYNKYYKEEYDLHVLKELGLAIKGDE